MSFWSLEAIHSLSAVAEAAAKAYEEPQVPIKVKFHYKNLINIFFLIFILILPIKYFLILFIFHLSNFFKNKITLLVSSSHNAVRPLFSGIERFRRYN